MINDLKIPTEITSQITSEAGALSYYILTHTEAQEAVNEEAALIMGW